jgi:hypothetical protein
MLDHRRVTRAPGWSPQPPAGFRPPGRNLPPRRPGGLLIGIPCLPLARLRWGIRRLCLLGAEPPGPRPAGLRPPDPPVVGVGFWGVWGVCWLALQSFSPSPFAPHHLHSSPFAALALQPFTPFAVLSSVLRRLRSSPLRLPTFTPSDLLVSVLRHLRRPSPFHLSAPFGRTRSPAPRPSLLTPSPSVASPFDPSRPFDLLPSVLRPFTFRRSSAAPLHPHLALRRLRSSPLRPPPHSPSDLHTLRPFTPFCLPSFDTFAVLCPFAFRRSLAASLWSQLALRVFAPHIFALQTSHPSPFVVWGWGGVSWWGVEGWGIGRCWLCRSCLLFRFVVLVGLGLLLFCLPGCLRCLLWIVGCLLCRLLLLLLGLRLLLSLFLRLVLCLGLIFVVGWQIWLALPLGRLRCLFVGRRLVLLLVGLGFLLLLLLL